MARTISLLCSLGDVTIAWQPSNDAAMLPIIQQMIENKIRFHKVTSKGNIRAIERPSQAMKARKIILPDESLQRLAAAGMLMITALMIGDTTGEIATTAQEVIDSDTVATQPARGG